MENKESLIRMIEYRIKEEHKKHSTLEWEKIAAHKILISLIEKLDNHPLDQVTDFMRVMDHPVPDVPQIPEFDRVHLRISLISEEYQELLTAIEKMDIVAIADALQDLKYVIYGMENEFGLNKASKELFSEVHSSNMSKICTSLEEAQRTQERYAMEDMRVSIKPKDGYFVIERAYDNKTLKSINYKPADLKPILEKYSKEVEEPGDYTGADYTNDTR